jgi:hypothetical protein
MKERHDPAGFGVNRSNIGPLLQVAADATQAQVGYIVRPKMLPSDDVIDLVGES